MKGIKSPTEKGRIEAILHEVENHLEFFAENRPIHNAHEGAGILWSRWNELDFAITSYESEGRDADHKNILRYDATLLAAAAVHFVAITTDAGYKRVLVDVEKELDRARAVYRPFSSGYEAYAVVREEMEELWEEVKEATCEIPKMRKEAIQIAAMAMRTVIDLCGPVNPARRGTSRIQKKGKK